MKTENYNKQLLIDRFIEMESSLIIVPAWRGRSLGKSHMIKSFDMLQVLSKQPSPIVITSSADPPKSP
jgi:hypothetical protein